MIVEHISKKEEVALTTLKPGEAFILDGKTFILADLRMGLFNIDDQEDSLLGVIILEITEKGLIHQSWSVAFYENVHVRPVEIYRIVIR